MATYEGWKNYETWNVSLWINNDFNLYKDAVTFMQSVNPIKDAYKGFVIFAGLAGSFTPDDVEWMSDLLDFSELDSMMKEMVA